MSFVLAVHAHPPEDYILVHDLAIYILLIRLTSFLPYVFDIKNLNILFFGLHRCF